jgi:hypothetical protein
MVVVVLFGVFVVVFEGLVAPLEGAAEREVGGGVELEGDGVVVGAEDGDLVGQAALDHGVAVGDDYNVGGFEPGVDDGFDGVVATAVVVGDLIDGEGIFALVGDLVTAVSGPDLDYVDFFPGQDDALVGDEADALGLGAIVAGELADGGEVDGDAGGRAAEEAGDASVLLLVAAVQPGVAAEGFDHLVEELAAALLGGLADWLGWSGAGDLAGLPPERMGECGC